VLNQICTQVNNDAGYTYSHHHIILIPEQCSQSHSAWNNVVVSMREAQAMLLIFQVGAARAEH